MSIRSTVNEGIQRVVRTGRGEGINLVLAGASEALAVLDEKRKVDTPEVFQTTTPASDFNGTVE